MVVRQQVKTRGIDFQPQTVRAIVAGGSDKHKVILSYSHASTLLVLICPTPRHFNPFLYGLGFLDFRLDRFFWFDGFSLLHWLRFLDSFMLTLRFGLPFRFFLPQRFRLPLCR